MQALRRMISLSDSRRVYSIIFVVIVRVARVLSIAMFLLKIIPILLAAIAVKNIICETRDHEFFLKSIRCNGSEEFVYQNYSCYVKSLNRTFSSLSARFDYKKPLSNIFVRLWSFKIIVHLIIKQSFKVDTSLSYKYGLIYREVLKTPRLDWCSLYSQKLNNLLVKQLVLVINDTLPWLIHSCPYSVTFLKV